MKNSHKNTRNYTAKRLFREGTGRTQVIPNKKKNSEEDKTTEEYLSELEGDIESD